MTYENVLDIIDELEGSLRGYLQMLNLDTKILNNRNLFSTVCEPKEIVENYIEELQEILDNLKDRREQDA